jgi:hypothetical protein
MEHLFVLALGLLFLFSLSPVARRAYERCYYPIVRPPTTELWINLMSLFTVALVLVFLYANTGGGLSFLVKGSFANPEALKTGALVGAFVFSAARTWALIHSQEFAKSLYFSAILAVSGFLSIGVFYRETWTTISDEISKSGSDELKLLPFCLFFALAAVALSETFAIVMDVLFSDSKWVPFTLARQQLESFENYPRLRWRGKMLRQMRSELDEPLHQSRITHKPLTIKWLTTNASTEIREAIEDRVRINASRHGPAPTIQVLCYDDDDKENRRTLEEFDAAKRYFRSGGNFRLLLYGNSVAFLGIQMGKNRHQHFPDYVMVIKEPIRLGVLKVMFDNCWLAAEETPDDGLSAPPSSPPVI